MPRRIEAEGKTYEVPDDATPEEVNQIVGGPSASPPVAPAPKSLLQQGKEFVDRKFANNDIPGSEALRPVGNIGRRAVRSLVDQVADLPGKIADIHTDYTPANIQRAFSGGDQYVQTAKDKGVTQAVTDAGGDLLAAELGGKAISSATDVAATGLNAGGRLAKKAGSLTSRLAVSAPPPSDLMDADVGRGLAQNRIVGISPRSLSRKVADTVGPASEARNAILSRSTAAPVDVAPTVTSPFEDIARVKTDPRTGAAQPAAVRRLTTSRKAITHIADPESGAATGEAKDLALSPAQIADLQKNVYGMTDYSTPENDLANQGLKGAAKGLKDKLNEVAPEATPFTDNIHDLLGAEDVLKGKGSPGEVHSLTQAGIRAGKMARVGLGTAAGAGLDAAGSGMMDLAGAIRRARSPVAPATGSPVAPESPGVRNPPRALPGPGQSQSNPESNFPSRVVPPPSSGSPGTVDGRSVPSVTVPPPPVKPAGLLEQVSGPSNSSPVAPTPPQAAQPLLNEGTARTRIAPTEFTPQQGGNAFGHRKLIIAPDGSIRPEPIPLAPPRAVPQLEATTGRGAPSVRPSLLAKMKGEMEGAAAGEEGRIAASREKVEGVPESNTPPPKPNFASRATRMTKRLLSSPSSPTNVPVDSVKPGDYSLTHALDVFKGAHGGNVDLIKSEGINPEYAYDGQQVHAATDPEVAKEYGDKRLGTGDKDTVFHTQLPAKTRVGTYKSGMVASPGDYTKSGVVGIRDPIPPSKVKLLSEKLPSRIPGPTDIDAWEKLVDDGLAHYDVHSHSYQYTGGKK